MVDGSADELRRVESLRPPIPARMSLVQIRNRKHCSSASASYKYLPSCAAPFTRTGGGAGAMATLSQDDQAIIPRGFYFMPTDEQLLADYLRHQAAGRHPPHGLCFPFRELFVSDGDPWVVQQELPFPYGKDGEFYCYSHRSRRGCGAARTTASGAWVAKGRCIAVRSRRTKELLGHKLALKFVPNKGGHPAPDARRSNWIMHEYRLDAADPSSASSTVSSSGLGATRFQEVVLCRIYQRKTNATTITTLQANESVLCKSAGSTSGTLLQNASNGAGSTSPGAITDDTLLQNASNAADDHQAAIQTAAMTLDLDEEAFAFLRDIGSYWPSGSLEF